MDGQASEFFQTSTAKMASKRTAVQQGFVSFPHFSFSLTHPSRRNPAADFYAMNTGSTNSEESVESDDDNDLPELMSIPDVAPIAASTAVPEIEGLMSQNFFS